LRTITVWEKECSTTSEPLPTDLKTREEFTKKKLQMLGIIYERMVTMFRDLVLVDPAESKEAFGLENFYNTLNLIRVHEFTILDIMQIPKEQQAFWVTPEIFIFPEDSMDLMIPIGLITLEETKKIIKRRLNDSLNTKIREDFGKKGVVLDFHGWSDSIAVEASLAWISTHLKKGKWECANTDCTKKESFSGEFKHCARCTWVRYCGKDCQVAHWKKEHKKSCGTSLKREDVEQHRTIVGPE